jgi:hypothetical protein
VNAADVAERLPDTAPGGVADHPRRRPIPSGWLLLGVYAIAVALYSVLALRSPLPSLFPDEYRYAHLARGLADGTGFDWHGVHIDQTAALYVYFIAPAWAVFGSTVDAYNAAKILGTLALCTQVVPVWWLSRELLGSDRLALAPAALSVAGTWMLAATTTATEALAYPLTTTALCLTVLALRRPQPVRLGLLALLFALLAAWARIQLAVLLPVVLGAFALDLVRLPPGRRAAAARARRPLLLVGGALVATGLIAALAVPSVTGDYNYVVHLRPGLGAIARKTGLQLLELTALAAFVPVLLAGGAALSPRAWRDDRSGPLLLVFWLAALATAVQSGFYIASVPGVPSGIDRYVAYAVPLAVVLLVLLAQQPQLVARAGWALAALLAPALLAAPRSVVEAIERGIWTTGHRVDGLVGVHDGPALLLAALVLLALTAAGGALARRRHGHGARQGDAAAAVVVAAILLGAFAIQGQVAWKQHLDLTRSFRATLGPDLQWVDHHSSGPVAFLGATQNPPQFGVVDFFNRHVTHAYVPAGGLPGRVMMGGQCAWQIAPQTGLITFADGCGMRPGARFFVDDPTAQITLAHTARTADDSRLGHVAELAPGSGPPRVRALLFVPCPRYVVPTTAPVTCRPQLAGQFWNDAAGELVLRFRGGAAPHAVASGTRTWDLPPRVMSTVRLAVPAGPSRLALSLDWTTPDATPELASARITGAGENVDVAYPAG